MKAGEFKKLLQGIREVGAYLRGNDMSASRIDRITLKMLIVQHSSLKQRQRSRAFL